MQLTIQPAPSTGIALITGASSGIGAVYADRLARRGHDLLLVARARDRLDQIAERVKHSTGRHVDIIACDLATKRGQEIVEERIEQDERIRVLVNNAGVGSTSTMLESNVEALDAMIQLNVVAVTRLARAAAAEFVIRGGGTIINIASVVALAPELLNGTYSATKSFVLTLTQALAHELGSKGVKVQAVLPGATHTDFWRSAGADVEQIPAKYVMSAQALVDAALRGVDEDELVTIPSLPDPKDWERLEAARRALAPNLSRQFPASRYGIRG